MSIINNLIFNNDTLSFEINNKNNFKISLINGIRRIIIGKVYTYALDYNNDNILFNDTLSDNSFLLQRLALLPIKCNTKLNYKNLVFTLNIENNNNTIKSYYLTDFKIKDNNNDIPVEDIFVHPKILFCKLKFNQSLSINSFLNYDNSDNGGSYFMPVCNCKVTFKRDDKLIKNHIKEKNFNEEQIKEFMLLDASRFYSKKNDGNPSIYNFELESNGQFTCNELINMSINLLKERLDNIKTSIKNNNNSKIIYEVSDSKMNAYDITLFDEDDTIGNLLQQYLSDIDNIYYIAYVIPHPLDNKLLLRVSYKNQKNSIDSIKDEIFKIIDVIKIKLDEILNDFNKNINIINKSKK